MCMRPRQCNHPLSQECAVRFSEDELVHIAASCKAMAICLASVVEDASLDETDRAELAGHKALLEQFGEGLTPVAGTSLVDMDSEDRLEHPRRVREAFQTMARDLQSCRILAMRKMLAKAAVTLAAILAEGDAEALEDLLTRLGFLTFNA